MSFLVVPDDNIGGGACSCGGGHICDICRAGGGSGGGGDPPWIQKIKEYIRKDPTLSRLDNLKDRQKMMNLIWKEP
jgi:hypothetical protein